MYSLLLSLHSLFRWLVLISLLISIGYAYRGFIQHRIFTGVANSLRHWTATIVHLQLLIGITLYFQSPLLKLPMLSTGEGRVSEQSFFRYIHLGLMILAVLVITIGSAKAKRMETDEEKYRTMFRWFSMGLLLLFIAIPWPFSPLVTRPFFRPF